MKIAVNNNENSSKMPKYNDYNKFYENYLKVKNNSSIMDGST